jgi:iron complex outermembrane receptor protein
MPLEIGVETQLVAPQNRVAHSELPTPGAVLLHAHIVWNFPIASRTGSLTLRAENLLDTKYLNHMSYYRQVDIPEPGRNIVLSLTIPFHVTIQ